MSPFSASQVRALAELTSALGDRRIVLIGAAALAHHIGMSWRTTQDLDVTIAADLDDVATRIGSIPAWVHSAKEEQSWTSSAGARVDVLPAGPLALESGSIEWPSTGMRMSLVGFEHVFTRAEPVRVADGLDILVAPLTVLFMLKAIAYDERPTERERDLSDLAYMLELHPGPEDPRRYHPEVQRRGLTHEQSGPFVLGTELAGFIHESEREVLDRFVRTCMTDSDGGRTRSLMLRNGPRVWAEEEQELTDRISALREGLDHRGSL